MQKPDWWPQCPYPTDIFPMPRGRYMEIVPDPDVRTALSGMLGRLFWTMAEEMIWQRFCEAVEDGRLILGTVTTRIGINTVTPRSLIDIQIGDSHFTEEHIKRWSSGDLRDIDFATGQESLIIEYLALLVVEKVLPCLSDSIAAGAAEGQRHSLCQGDGQSQDARLNKD